MNESEIVIKKLNEIVSKKPSKWLEKAKEREANHDWSMKSAKIALLILNEIKARKISREMSQKMLAEKMGVSAQYVNKILKGQENLSLETISKIEKALGISLIEIRSFEEKSEIGDNFSNALKNLQSMRVYSNKFKFFKVKEDSDKPYILQSIQVEEDFSVKNEFSNFEDIIFNINQSFQLIDDISGVEFSNFRIDIRKKSATFKKSESENIFA